MPNLWSNIRTLSLAIVLTVALLTVARAADQPAVRADKNPAIEITRIKPSRGDIRKAQQKTGADSPDPHVHVVKIYVTMPPPAAKSYPLYIGDVKIDQYGGFAEGIFFKVYHPADLASWKGKPLTFRDGNDIINLGVTFPDRPPGKASAQLPELRDVLKTN